MGLLEIWTNLVRCYISKLLGVCNLMIYFAPNDLVNIRIEGLILNDPYFFSLKTLMFWSSGCVLSPPRIERGRGKGGGGGWGGRNMYMYTYTYCNWRSKTMITKDAFTIHTKIANGIQACAWGMIFETNITKHEQKLVINIYSGSSYLPLSDQ